MASSIQGFFQLPMRFQPTDGSSPIHNGATTAVFVLIQARGRQVPWDAPDLTDEPDAQKGVRNVPVTEQGAMKHKES